MREYKYANNAAKKRCEKTVEELSEEVVDLLWKLRKLAPERKISIDGGSMCCEFSLQDANIYTDELGMIVFDIEG